MDMRRLGRLVFRTNTGSTRAGTAGRASLCGALALTLTVACNDGQADGSGDGGGDGDGTSATMTATMPTTQDTDNLTIDSGVASMGMGDSTGMTATGMTATGMTATGMTATGMSDTDSTSMSGSDTMGMTDTEATMGSTTDPPPRDGCGAIDFLFVIDNSGSMADQQTQLLASFPAFIAAIQASLTEVDSYHVGVITSDAYAGNQPGCQGLGDLVTQTAGDDSAGLTCTPFAEGNRFATEMDDLDMVFPCMAQVGTDGSGDELPISATIAALDPSNGMAGACNEGFLRDEALLVVIALTDDPPWVPDIDDAHPMADTSGWYDAIVAAKNGDPEAMVVVGFVPWDDTDCVFGMLESPNLINFVQDFGMQGVLASICEDDYGPTFNEAVGIISTTCDSFEPM